MSETTTPSEASIRCLDPGLTEDERDEIVEHLFLSDDPAEALGYVRDEYPYARDEELHALMVAIAEMEEAEAASGRHDAELTEDYCEHAELLREAAADLLSPPRATTPGAD